MKNDKVCPLGTITAALMSITAMTGYSYNNYNNRQLTQVSKSLDDTQACKREQCAWWTPSGECAITNLAHMMGDVGDRIAYVAQAIHH